MSRSATFRRADFTSTWAIYRNGGEPPVGMSASWSIRSTSWKEMTTCPEGTRKVARVHWRTDQFGNRYANHEDVRERCEGDVVK
jgi:hypothetical protein